MDPQDLSANKADIQQHLERARAKRPDLDFQIASAMGYEVIIASAEPATYARFRAEINDPRKQSGAIESIFRACCVYPGPNEVDAMLTKRPGLAETFGNEVLKLAGLGVEVKVKNA